MALSNSTAMYGGVYKVEMNGVAALSRKPEVVRTQTPEEDECIRMHQQHRVKSDDSADLNRVEDSSMYLQATRLINYQHRQNPEAKEEHTILCMALVQPRQLRNDVHPHKFTGVASELPFWYAAD